MPQAPKPSLSPSPESVAIKVSIPDGSEVLVKKRHLRQLWVWVGPLILSLLGTAFGYIRGYAQGLADAAERLTKIETRAKSIGERVAAIEERTDGVEKGLAAESRSNRAERATALERYATLADDLSEVKKSMPKIQGLTNTKK